MAKYLNGAFEFFTKTGLLDTECKIVKILDARANEFDIVAIYQNAIPKIVFEKRMVPYDSVAFLIEIKKTLTLPFIKADLEKYEKLNNLRISEPHDKSMLKRPLRALFYCDSKIDEEELELLLSEKEQSWDLCIILDKDLFILNKELPLKKAFNKSEKHLWVRKNALFKGMFFACVSVKADISNGWMLYWNLFRSIDKGNHEKIQSL